MTEDTVFSGRAERFRERIYGSGKGQLRLELIWRDLWENLPGVRAGGLSVWDAGGGLGQISACLAAAGHRVTFTEPAADLLAMAREALPDSVRCSADTIQRHTREPCPAYDLVVCHAVLEWLGDARGTLPLLVRAIRPGAYLSLLFYNVHAIALSNIVKGNLYKAASEDFAGQPGSFTPPAPLVPLEVARWLEDNGLSVEHRRSVRFVHDLLSKPLREKRSLEDIMALEWQYGAREPYWQLGRYVHLIARKA